MAAGVGPLPQADLSWRALPRAAQLYVAIVTGGGALVLIAMFPLTYPRPPLFAAVLIAACVTAAWKVTLPLPLTSGSTLSVSSAAKLMALLLLGPRPAMVIAVAGTLAQCLYHVRHPYPLYRTTFSMMAEAIAMAGTGVVYVALGGVTPPADALALAKPLVGAIVTYFVLATGLVAGAIATSTDRPLLDVWRNGFLWSGVTFMVAGSAGAAAAGIIERGYYWIALLLLAPLYLTYRTYQVFIGRFEDQQRHIADMHRMHRETVDALSQAHRAERELADEKERLGVALAEMTRLEEIRHELLEREHAARANAEQANRLKDQFLAIVSHELRTPLNAILGWADLLRSGRLEEQRRERAFVAIYDSARRQAQLIDELLDVARIMSGKLRLERTFVEVDDVVREALTMVLPTADAKHVSVNLERVCAVGAIYADRGRLQQIVWNLFSNAIKFTPEGGSVHVRLDRDVDGVIITVRDTGQGIPPEFLASMFEPFRQIDGSTSRPHGGLGLGLSIVKHLVEGHGGNVTAHSDGLGHGATLVVRLPIALGPTEQMALGAAVHQALPPREEPDMLLDGIRVLVVDDDDEGRQVVATQLEGRRAVVLTAASATEALQLLQRERVDVLLADIAMPNEDGYTLIRKLRALHPALVASTPAAALTAFARTEDRFLALEAGFQLHVAKPVEGEALVTAVAQLYGMRHDRRPGQISTRSSTVSL